MLSELNELKQDLLLLLIKDAEMPINANLTEQEKDNLFRALFLMRAEESVEDKLLVAQNKFLSKVNKINEIDINNLKFKNNIAFCNNILNLNADLVVIISNTLFENIDELANFNIDNEIILKAGLEFKANLLKLFRANAGRLNFDEPYITPAYNLNCKYIAKIIYNKKYFNLIIFNNKNIKNDVNFINFLNILKNNLLFLLNFVKNNKINSVAFHFNFVNLSLAEENDKQTTLSSKQKIDNINKLKENLIKYIKNLFKKQKIKLIFNL